MHDRPSADDLIRRILTDTDETDPVSIADMVVNSLSEDQFKETLLQLMPARVRTIYSKERRAQPPMPRQRAPQGSSPEPRFASPRVQMIHEEWQRHLRDRVFIARRGEYRMLGTCDYADIRDIAEQRQKLADANLHWKRKYNRLAELLTQHDVETVNDLPAYVKREYFEDFT